MLTFLMRCAIVFAMVLSGACTEKTTAEKTAKAEQQPIEALLNEIDILNDQCRGGSGDASKTLLACDEREAKAHEAEQRGWCWGPRGAFGADRHWMRCADDKNADNQASGEWFGLTGQGKCRSATVSEVVQFLESKTGGIAKSRKEKDGTILVFVPREDGGNEYARLYPSCDAAFAADHNLTPAARTNESPQVQGRGEELVSIAELKKMTVIGMQAFKPYRVSAMINALNLGTDGLCERLRYDGYCADGIERVYVNIDFASGAERSQLYDLRGKEGAAICATVVMHPRNVNGTMNLIRFSPGRCN